VCVTGTDMWVKVCVCEYVSKLMMFSRSEFQIIIYYILCTIYYILYTTIYYIYYILLQDFVTSQMLYCLLIIQDNSRPGFRSC